MSVCTDQAGDGVKVFSDPIPSGSRTMQEKEFPSEKITDDFQE